MDAMADGAGSLMDGGGRPLAIEMAGKQEGKEGRREVQEQEEERRQRTTMR